MSDTVVDSSVVDKWILPEPDSAQAQRLISEVAQKGERLIVLDLVFAEVANAIWKQYHRTLATLDEARNFLTRRDCHPISTATVVATGTRSSTGIPLPPACSAPCRAIDSRASRQQRILGLG